MKSCIFALYFNNPKRFKMANLFKVFTRAMVSQVARDTGKVISNSVYGDKHATPVRHVGKQYNNDVHFTIDHNQPATLLSHDEYRNIKTNEGWKPQYLYLGDSFGKQIGGWILKLFLFIFCAIIPLLGLIPPLWMAIAKFNKKNITMFKYESTPSYVGSNFVGYSMQKNVINMPANRKDKRLLNIYGMIYLGVFILNTCLLGYVINNVDELPENITIDNLFLKFAGAFIIFWAVLIIFLIVRNIIISKKNDD